MSDSAKVVYFAILFGGMVTSVGFASLWATIATKFHL